MAQPAQLQGTFLLLALLALAALEARVHHAAHADVISHTELGHFASAKSWQPPVSCHTAPVSYSDPQNYPGKRPQTVGGGKRRRD